MSRLISQRGFTLLLAALVSSIVLSLAVSIFDIAQKQVLLASMSQQSQYAFFAADTAAECALYWDVKPAVSYFSQTPPTSPSPQCDGSTLSIVPPSDSSTYPYTYTINMDLADGFGASVTIQKCQGQITDGGTCCPGKGVTNGSCDNSKNVVTISTQIRANGYNVPRSALDSPNSSLNVLERSVVLNY